MRAQAASILILSTMTLLSGGGAKGAIVDFGESQPMVVAGQTLSLNVSITYEGGDPNSLFSFGVAVLPEPGSMSFSVMGIDVPVPLDFNGVAGPGASKTVLPDLIAVKGTVNLATNPIQVYSGTLLATFNFRFDQPGLYPLRLDFFNTLGPTEAIFITGEGIVIDDRITFGSTIVQVIIPEPTCSSFLVLTALAGLSGRRIRRPFPLNTPFSDGTRPDGSQPCRA